MDHVHRGDEAIEAELGELRQRALDGTAPLIERLRAAVQRMERMNDLIEMQALHRKDERPQ